MDESSNIINKRVVLEAIGKNVLNLQKMEGMFKTLVAHRQYKGPLAQFPTVIAAHRDEISRKSLGQLVGEFIRELRTEEPTELEDIGGLSVPELAFRCTFVLSENDINVLKDSLKILVDERNLLIHQKLLSFDIESNEDCRQMLKDLSEQRTRILPVYKYLQASVRTLHEMTQEALIDLKKQLGQ